MATDILVTRMTPPQLHFDVSGTGEPLLLLHGFSGSGADWNTLPPEWSPGFQRIAPDLPGHGRSGILSKPFRHQDAAADVLALLDHLRINFCKAIGISCGGNILPHMPTQQPGP